MPAAIQSRPLPNTNLTSAAANTTVLNGNSSYTNPAIYKGVVPTGNFILFGYVRIYVTSGTTLTLPTTSNITYKNPSLGTDAQNAQRLQIYVTAAGPTSLNQNGNGQIDAEVNAPSMDFSIGGTVNFTGWIVAKSLTFKGNANYSSDGTRDNNTNTPSAFTVHLVDTPTVVIH